MFGPRLVSGIVLIIIAILALSMGGPVLAGILLAISLIAYRELTKALGVSGSFRTRNPQAGSMQAGGAQACGTQTGSTQADSTQTGGTRAVEIARASEDLQAVSSGRKSGGFNLLEILGMAGVVLYYATIYFSGTEVLQLMCIVGVFMALMFAYVVTFPRFHAEQVVGAFFAFMYAPVMLSFVYLTRICPQGIYIVWMILISSWGCDTCAYVVGKLIGKKRIFPHLSPKKSLEGCIGGVLGAALIGGLYGHFFVEAAFPDQTVMWILAFICAVGAVMSQVGDLAASAIKRNHNIKDYGKLIPGHGGIMDRFDSMIVTAPMIYFLAILLIRF